ncbi:hypothetical protein L484_005186 [Morus notabilis]|uniref:Pentatricopeptide repeat-containing protein n=1 Tax=Morus notabilis TaxID=981085 RepID=W9QJ10_9ROSA|nr:pentatricopeptide repeat-containing protein At1g62930, chloroplastic [Morus notabilis]EXB24807.1 hypothetical protein L484_005186 [Morus notabilis]
MLTAKGSVVTDNASSFSSLFPRFVLFSRTQFPSVAATATNKRSITQFSRKSKRRWIAQFGGLIRKKSKVGTLELEEALGYFNSMVQMQSMPCIWAFNHLLGAVYNMNHHPIVVYMYREMNALCGVCFRPDIRTMSVVIRCLCQLERIDLCFSVLATVFKLGLRPDACLLNTLLHGLCVAEGGSVDAAFELFVKMVEDEQICDDITYGTMINGFCKAGETWKAVGLLKRMYDQKRIKPDGGCYCPIIHGLCKEGRVDEAFRFLQDMVNHDVRPNVVICNSLIHGLLESGRCEQAMEFLETMTAWGISPNIVTYNTMLNALCKENRIKEALDLVEEMSNAGLEPDCITYNCLISGFGRLGEWRKAMNLLHEMEYRGIRPNIFTYNILLYGLSYSGEWKVLSRLLDEMVSLKIFPQTVTLNGILDAYSERGNMNTAEKLFDEMIRRGLKPDTLTYNILIKGYCLLGEMDKASAVFEEMSLMGVQPDIFSYNVLVIGYINVDRVYAAQALLEDVIQKGLEPNDVTLGCWRAIHARRVVAFAQ